MSSEDYVGLTHRSSLMHARVEEASVVGGERAKGNLQTHAKLTRLASEIVLDTVGLPLECHTEVSSGAQKVLCRQTLELCSEQPTDGVPSQFAAGDAGRAAGVWCSGLHSQGESDSF